MSFQVFKKRLENTIAAFLRRQQHESQHSQKEETRIYKKSNRCRNAGAIRKGDEFAEIRL
jgi:hypothetical protein